MKRGIIFLFVLLSNGWLYANHWIPEDAQFEDNMTLTGVIIINGVEQLSADYELGAFCGDQCRGSVMPMYFPPTQRYIVQLTVFGETGDQLTFKIFDHSQGLELDVESPEAVTFNGDGYGTLANPYLLEFTIHQPDPGSIPLPSEVVITLKPGWNWISYLLTVEKPLAEVFVNLTPSPGDLIKEMTRYSTYRVESSQWEGSLDTMIPGRGYIYLNSSTETKTFTYPSY